MEDEKSIDDMTTEELEAEFKTLGVTPEPIQEDTVDLEGTTDSNTTEATETVPGDTTEAPEDFVFEEEKYKEKTSEELLKEMKKISIQNYHKEKMIQRQALEIGRVRKQ
jgi:hypothetical protein